MDLGQNWVTLSGVEGSSTPLGLTYHLRPLEIS